MLKLWKCTYFDTYDSSDRDGCDRSTLMPGTIERYEAAEDADEARDQVAAHYETGVLAAPSAWAVVAVTVPGYEITVVPCKTSVTKRWYGRK